MLFVICGRIFVKMLDTAFFFANFLVTGSTIGASNAGPVTCASRPAVRRDGLSGSENQLLTTSATETVGT